MPPTPDVLAVGPQPCRPHRAGSGDREASCRRGTAIAALRGGEAKTSRRPAVAHSRPRLPRSLSPFHPPSDDIRNEKITGNTATAEILTAKGNWEEQKFVKEDGKWKLKN